MKSMFRFVFITGLLLLVIPLYAQVPYFLVEEYGSVQSTGDVIIEHKNHLYVAGQYIIPEDYERNIQIRKYTHEGELLKTIVWDNDLENGGLNFLSDDAISIRGDSFVMNIKVSNNIHDCAIIMDDDLNELRQLSCHSYDSDIGITASTQLLKGDKFYVGLDNYKKINLLGCYDFATDSFDFVQLNTDSEDFFNSEQLYNKDGSILHLGFRGIIPDPDDRITIIAQLMVQELDIDLNLIVQHYIGDSFDSSHIESVMSPEGTLVISAREGDRNNGQEWLLMSRPVILGLNNDHTIKWRKTVSDTSFQNNWDFFRSIIQAKDNGYVLVGQKGRGEVINNIHDGNIMRVDSVGNELWKLVIADPYDDVDIILNDVILTSEGHYMAVGKRSDRNGDADPWTSRVQTVFIKFDDQGNILERSSANYQVVLTSNASEQVLSRTVVIGL